MLSPPPVAPATPGAGTSTTTTTTTPSTRRRGLSYLRSLSSHSSSSNPNGADQPRTSPRQFFQRSSSYNSDKPKATGRRRSVSKPDEPTRPTADTATLSRVISADSPLSPEDPHSSEDARPSRPRARGQTLTADEDMARNRLSAGPARPAEMIRSSSGNGSGTDESNRPPPLPTIKLFPHHQETRNGRQSLHFQPISRTLPTEGAILRVGRYSEREGLPVLNPPGPSDAPIGFKSKVVSRKHCEFCFVDGQWNIRDVASSSGTFLNHIRLSQPNQESRLYPIKDGDIVQLGIDFRGGEEMIFRCVKIRVECNRSWQKKPNTFNKSRRAQLLGLSKDQPAAGNNNGECSICLGSVLPCQALFVAPCAHVWHYKCIRPMLEGRQSQYPQFQCPNCRAYADLEADVDMAEDEMDAWNDHADTTDEHLETDQGDPPPSTEGNTIQLSKTLIDESALTASPALSALLTRRTQNPQQSTPTTSNAGGVNGIDIPSRQNPAELQASLDQHRVAESPNPDQIIVAEGPLTPRNNAGPFVFDGSGAVGGLAVPGLAEVAEERA